MCSGPRRGRALGCQGQSWCVEAACWLAKDHPEGEPLWSPGTQEAAEQMEEGKGHRHQGRSPFLSPALQSRQRSLCCAYLLKEPATHPCSFSPLCFLFHWFLPSSILFPSFYLLWVYFVPPFLASSGSILDF